MPRKLALLIGVSEYGEGFDPLTAPPNDVAALQRVLENPALGGFAPAEVNTLINPGPIEMQQGILQLFSRSTKNDLILLFFSGHGITNDDNHLYFCTRRTSKVDYLATAVPARFIQGLSNTLNYAKRQVMILDCCYSGAFAEGWQRKGDIKINLERELGKEGRVVLTSSSATQVSFQQEDADLSLYTQYLVEGIETGGADTDRDGEVKVRELHDYAKRKVQEAKPKMKPDIIADDEGYDILLSRVNIDAESRFQQLVEKYVDHQRGEIINQRSQEILEVQARRLNLASEDASAIISRVLEPTRRRLKSLKRYRQEYEAEVQKQYPLDDRTRDNLREWQQAVLGLEDSDVTGIQTEINAAIEKDQRQHQILKQQQHSETERVGLESETQQPKEQSHLFLKTFEFETAKITQVEKKGGILGLGGEVVCSIKRDRLTAKAFAQPLRNNLTLEMVQIPAGRFIMGSSTDEEDRLDSESPRHSVTVQEFFMGKFPITQAQYEAVIGNNPTTKYDADRFVDPDKPVVGVSWNNAIAFCEKLSQQTGNRYRLPSEAEWEYACRAGTKTPFFFGKTITTDLANYRGTDWNYQGTTFLGNYGSGPKGVFRKGLTIVGSFPPNLFGLFDMHGNVWEWCADYWHENYDGAPSDGSAWTSGENSDRRVIRGGSWSYYPGYCRSAARYHDTPVFQITYIGIRVVLAPR